MKKLKIFIVDDERILRVSLADDLREAGHRVMEFSNGQSALASLCEQNPDIVITDLKMPGIDGIELLKKSKENCPDVVVVMMTAHGTVENAVEAMKLGAYDYIVKPFVIDEIFLLIDRITELKNIKSENIRLKKKIASEYDFSAYIGDRETNKALFEKIKLIAEKDSTVLITGETGTGKEMVTNIIHFNSGRKKNPLVKVSCAILSKEIFESELFGHVKGAFTGADSEKQGRFELANSGTLYLDDVDDIPLDMQVKLLRALEAREIEKVGSSKTIPIDIRLIASSKKDLLSLVKQGAFREDLYYRLNVFPIDIPPLRNRKKDIPIILSHYLNHFYEGKTFHLDQEASQLLSDYNWPGNVRELKNMAERITILAPEGKIEARHIPSVIRQPEASWDLNRSIGSKPLNTLLADVELASIKYALEKCKYNQKKAAKLLDIPPTTLHTKMSKYGLA